MSENEHTSFGKKLAFYAAPTLLGIKCASLVSLSADEFNIDFHANYFNSKAIAKGLKTKILCSCKNRKLVLVYNEALLKKQLSQTEAKNILSEYGYPSWYTIDDYLERLSARIRSSGGFPHEIGVFLGYPTEDVIGFIQNKGENFKLCGAWKVYGSVEKAKRTFTNYDKCRNFLCNKLNEGIDIYKALKIS